ncbi:MAG TPA: DUF2079 domain-containing protein [Acidimicrobiales bacterium]|nr:DUF2079 domain-containing protein [Acidimicrobiales bacterium]
MTEELVARHRRDPYAVVVLGALLGVYVVIFGTLTWKQQSNFATFGYDMGIYDQGIWLVSRFREPFVTVRGLNYFGHHVNLITLVFVPFYWLGAGPHFLYLVETCVMAAGAAPVWLLAKDKTGAWVALVPAGAFLLFPSLEWINWWHFHPDALIITPLLFAWWFASRKRWTGFAIAGVIALLAKEDAALAVMVMGIVLIVRGERKWGSRALLVGLVWFVVCTQVIIPIANGGKEAFYEELFPGYGHSMKEILWTMIRHPSRTYRFAVLPDRLKYYRQLVFPLGGLPLLSPLVLLIAGPQTLVNIVSIHQPTHDIRYHYSSVLIAVLFIAMIEVFGWIAKRGRWWQLAVAVWLAFCSIASNVAFSPSPIGGGFDEAWAQRPRPEHAALNRALGLIKPDDKVTASYYIVPQLTHRNYIYEFPNPFRVSNWGIDGEDPPDVNTSDVLILDVRLNGTDQRLYETLVGEFGPFDVVFEDGPIVVARRKASP